MSIALSIGPRVRREGEAVTSALPSFEDEPMGALPSDAGYTAVRAMAISLAPALATSTSKMDVSLILRNQVYSRVPMRATPSGYDPVWMDVARAYREGVIDQSVGHECGGRTILKMIGDTAFGIRARHVGLWDRKDSINPATAFVHASSEVLIGGRWIVCDGHYNMTLRDREGRRRSWADAREMLLRGELIVVATDGYAQGAVTPDHYLNDVYHETMLNLTSYMATSIHRDVTGLHSARAEFGWNGMLTYIDGSSYDAVSPINGGVYAMLAA